MKFELSANSRSPYFALRQRSLAAFILDNISVKQLCCNVFTGGCAELSNERKNRNVGHAQSMESSEGISMRSRRETENVETNAEHLQMNDLEMR